MAVLAGIDFFAAEVLTWRGLETYYVLFFLHLETRRVMLAGITQHPTEEWMVQMARKAVDDIDGALLGTRFALHDHDTGIHVEHASHNHGAWSVDGAARTGHAIYGLVFPSSVDIPNDSSVTGGVGAKMAIHGPRKHLSFVKTPVTSEINNFGIWSDASE
jgi:hypothetical protein